MKTYSSWLEKNIHDKIHDFIRNHGKYPAKVLLSTLTINHFSHFLANRSEYQKDYIFGVEIEYAPRELDFVEVE